MSRIATAINGYVQFTSCGKGADGYRQIQISSSLAFRKNEWAFILETKLAYLRRTTSNGPVRNL
jgi:hypothetical protein